MRLHHDPGTSSCEQQVIEAGRARIRLYSRVLLCRRFLKGEKYNLPTGVPI